MMRKTGAWSGTIIRKAGHRSKVVEVRSLRCSPGIRQCGLGIPGHAGTKLRPPPRRCFLAAIVVSTLFGGAASGLLAVALVTIALDC
jgi:hypothetical protein